MTGSSPIPTRELTFENHNYVTSFRHHLKNGQERLDHIKIHSGTVVSDSKLRIDQ